MDGDAVGRLGDLGAHRDRGEVLRHLRDPLEPLGEAHLEEDRAEALDLVRELPDPPRGPGVRREEKRAALVLDGVADGRDGVVDGDRHEPEPGDLEGALALHLAEAEERAPRVRDALEVRPDLVVEDVYAERGDRLAERVDLERGRADPRVEDEGERGDVVDVRVREDDGLERARLLERERGGGAAGVEEDAAVEEVSGAATGTQLAAVRPEDPNPHP